MAVANAVQQFLSTVGNLATRLGFPVLIVVRDPSTRQVLFTGTPGALENMKPEIIAKVAPGGLDDEAVTGWEA